MLYPYILADYETSNQELQELTKADASLLNGNDMPDRPHIRFLDSKIVNVENLN